MFPMISREEFVSKIHYVEGQNMASSSTYKIPQYEDKFKTERKIANEIMQTVHKHQLPLKLDHLTEGLGNCFPIAVIQQCRRPEIYRRLGVTQQQTVRQEMGHSLLRGAVKQFI